MAGRPPLEVARTEKIEVRLTAEEKETLRMGAERMKISVSEYIRMVALDTAKTVQEGGSKQEVLESFAGTASAFISRVPDKGIHITFVMDEESGTAIAELNKENDEEET